MNELQTIDRDIYDAIELEKKRQRENIELIASENFVSLAVLEAQGSIMTNKYAEGYPNRRYYGGCGVVDIAEQLAIERVKKLFCVNFSHVQPPSGSQTKMAGFRALLYYRDRLPSQSPCDGGPFAARA